MTVNPIVYRRLVQAARVRETVTVAELGRLTGLSATNGDGRTIIDLMLDNIAASEAGNGRPLLAVVVVEVADGPLGAGLARYARRTGVGAEPEFLMAELDRVYGHWASK
jgi:hypothetical protein